MLRSYCFVLRVLAVGPSTSTYERVHELGK